MHRNRGVEVSCCLKEPPGRRMVDLKKMCNLLWVLLICLYLEYSGYKPPTKDFQTIWNHYSTGHLCQLCGPGCVLAHAWGRQQQHKRQSGVSACVFVSLHDICYHMLLDQCLIGYAGSVLVYQAFSGYSNFPPKSKNDAFLGYLDPIKKYESWLCLLQRSLV